jgi:glyoxylase-like metal-dependent hydrolase (beta-lactamase superfamily II)
MHTITPMVVALGPQREKSRFTYMHNFGEKVDIPYVSWLIEGGGRVILVDAGCSADDYKMQIRGDKPALMLAGERFADVQDIKPIEQHFEERGLSFDDVDTFIQTHLDWDHCMNTTKFRRSRILIQRAEWQRIPVHSLFASTYAPKEHYEAISKLNVEFVEGDYDVARGVRSMLTPGHSPGGQSVAVDTNDGTYVIAGMCTIRDNFYPPEDVLAKGTYKVIPAGMHMDPILCYDSMLRILDVGKDKVLPFHDIAAMQMGTLG